MKPALLPPMMGLSYTGILEEIVGALITGSDVIRRGPSAVEATIRRGPGALGTVVRRGPSEDAEVIRRS